MRTMTFLWHRDICIRRTGYPTKVKTQIYTIIIPQCRASLQCDFRSHLYSPLAVMLSGEILARTRTLKKVPSLMLLCLLQLLSYCLFSLPTGTGARTIMSHTSRCPPPPPFYVMKRRDGSQKKKKNCRETTNFLFISHPTETWDFGANFDKSWCSPARYNKTHTFIYVLPRGERKCCPSNPG